MKNDFEILEFHVALFMDSHVSDLCPYQVTGMQLLCLSSELDKSSPENLKL